MPIPLEGRRPPTLGEKIADKVRHAIGSWPYIILQTFAYAAWILVNVLWLSRAYRWDPYPFILLNLCLSFMAAYNGPLILIAQNRGEEDSAILQKAMYEMLQYVAHGMDAQKSIMRALLAKEMPEEEDDETTIN